MSKKRFQQPSQRKLSRAEHQAALKRLIEQHQMKVEALTEEQLAKAFLQAIECGDIQRLVRKVENPEGMDGSITPEEQMVIYEPFARVVGMDARIKQLEAALTANNIVIPPANTNAA